jgi:hypothetical protein
MTRDDPHFRLRIPETIKSRIEAEAAKNNRSATAEINQRLAQSLDQGELSGAPTLRDYFAGQAIAGMLSRDALERESYKTRWFADWAYEMADTMLAARAKSEPAP